MTVNLRRVRLPWTIKISLAIGQLAIAFRWLIALILLCSSTATAGEPPTPQTDTSDLTGQVSSAPGQLEATYPEGTFYTVANELMDEYRRSGATTFKDFHEQYIVLKRVYFPNIYGADYDFEFAEGDYDNPQKLIEYWDYVQKMRDPLRTDPNVIAIYRNRKKAKWSRPQSELKAEQDQIIANLTEYTKQGYYRYFRSYLEQEENNATLVGICVDLNDQLLGLNVYRPADEANQIRNDAVHQILQSLELGSYQNTFRTSECLLMIDVNLDALTKLYEHESVGQIIHPEILVLSYYRPRAL